MKWNMSGMPSLIGFSVQKIVMNAMLFYRKLSKTKKIKIALAQSQRQADNYGWTIQEFQY